MANTKENNTEKATTPGPAFEAPKGDTTAPEFTTTNISNQNPDTPPLGPGSPDTRTLPRRESIVVSVPTEAASNVTQVKGGIYRRLNRFYNAKGKEVDKDGNLIEN